MDENSKKALMDDDTKYDLKPPKGTALAPKQSSRSALLYAILLILAASCVFLRQKHKETQGELQVIRAQFGEVSAQLSALKAEREARLEVERKKAEEELKFRNTRVFTKQIRLAHSGGEARCIAVADYDGDGNLDVLICSSKFPAQGGINKLYRNNGRGFSDVTAEAGIEGGTRCASWADFDEDGDLDLYYCNGKLWANDKGVFADASSLIPKYPFTNIEGAGWLDANRDGRPDILSSDGDSGLHLMLNTGNAEQRFANVDEAWGLGRGGIGTGNGDFLSIADFTGDGFPDFIYNLGRAVPALNIQGRRFQVAERSGLTYLTENPFKLGPAFGDMDNDGDLDLFVPQNGKPMLFENNGDGTFIDVTDAAGDLAVAAAFARSAVWGDIDLDGRLDLIVGYPKGYARLFRNTGSNVFTDESRASNLSAHSAAQSATGMVLADFDNDGDLDLAVTSEPGHSGILLNNWSAADGRTSLKIRLNPGECPGTIVRLYDSDMNLLGTRQLGLVQTFSSQGPQEAIFGVKTNAEYSAVIVGSNGQQISSPKIMVGDERAAIEIK